MNGALHEDMRDLTGNPLPDESSPKEDEIEKNRTAILHCQAEMECYKRQLAVRVHRMSHAGEMIFNKLL